MSENLCGASEMTVARDGYGRLVRIRDRGVIDDWRGRKGLDCLVCGRGVMPFQSSQKNLFLRHDKSRYSGEFHATAQGLETYQHKVLKYWVRDQLRACGLAAEVEKAVGDQIPYVHGVRDDGARFAVEIQWSNLDVLDARRRTDGLHTAGCAHLVWLTRHRDWVKQLPALALRDFDPDSTDYIADSGFLELGSRDRLYVEDYSVREFLHQWTTDVLAWAYRNRTTAGWAAVTDWETYTRQQADTIGTQRRQLDAAAQRARDHEHAMEVAKAATRQVLGQRDDFENSLRTARSRIERLDQDRARLAAAASRRGRLVATLLGVCVVLILLVWLT